MQLKLLIGILAICSLTNSSFSKDYDLLRGLNDEEEAAVRNAYARTRALLGPDEVDFLEQILAADELIMERQSKGIVDQILATISGMSLGSLGIVGTGTGNNAPIVPNNQNSLPQRQVVAGGVPGQAPTNNAQTMGQQNNGMNMNNDNYLFSQVSKVVSNSVRRNVTGIVDEALKIGTPAPVRDLVNGILGVVYCNGIRRLLGRC